MPTRALGALLAAAAAVAFVVSIVSGAWWDGHPRVDGRVYTAKDVHIGLYGAEGCNTGGTGECQPLTLGTTFTSVAYGELGGVALATAFAILIAGAAWRIGDSRKRIARLGMVFAVLAAAGAAALIVLGPQIKSTQNVEPPIGWGLFVFGGGILAMFGGALATLRVEREPLRLKSPPKQASEPAFDVRDILREQHEGLRPSGPIPTGNLPGPAGPLGAPLFDGAPQLRPLYDVQGALPTPAAPQLPTRAPTPVPRASAHAIAGLDTPPPERVSPSPYGQPTPYDEAPTFELPNGQPPPFAQQQPPFAQQQPFGSRPKPPTGAPPPGALPPRIAPPGPRSKPASVAPPPSPTSPPFAARPGSPSSPPFAAQSRPALPGLPSARPAAPSTPPPFAAPSVAPPADPLAQTMPAPSRVAPPPRPPKISVPPPRATPLSRGPAPQPTPTPSIITSAPKQAAGSEAAPKTPAPRASQPTLAHAVPPMPVIDTPPPQLLRASTENDDRLETGMRETEVVTAVEIDHEAKAQYEEHRRQSAGRAETATGVGEPPTADDTDAVETAGRERVDTDAIADEVAAPPAQPVQPPAPQPAPMQRPSQPAPRTSQPVIPNIAPIAPIAPASTSYSTAPASLPPPKTATLPVSGPTPACPQCESPMAWVEEHLRFYCKSCRMYF